MSAIHKLTRREARRIAIRAQLLDATRPSDLLLVVGHLTFLQLDPIAAVAPAADMVAWTRLGAAYQPEHLVAALEEDRTMFEVRAIIRPTADLGLYLEAMALWPFADGAGRNSAVPGPGAARWLQANDGFRSDILDLLRRSGPLMSRDIPDTSIVPWKSTGWTGNRNVTQMLEFLSARGEIATTRRVGRQRLWDLAERVYPAVVPVPLAKARRILARRRLQALGIARPVVVGIAGERNSEEVAGEPAEVEGTAGEWRVAPELIDLPFEGRTALLSPFDRLIHDRVRARQLFDYEYVLEMYKPKDTRRWGYYALPILHDDRLVGKVDAVADRKGSILQVNAIHEDVAFSKTITRAVHRELEALATWLGLADIRLP